MSRTGVEKKPPWQDVPIELRQLIGEKLGSPVARGMRIWGSYGPGPSYRLKLKNGDRAFVKSLWPESNEFQVKALAIELTNYRDLASLMKPWAPEFLGEVKYDDWHAMLLEDVGPKTAPPWRGSDAKTVAQELAKFHDTNVGAKFPDSLKTLGVLGILRTSMWSDSVSDSDFEGLASLSRSRPEALKWLEANAGALVKATDQLKRSSTRPTLLHVDTRSDNLRVVNGKLRLFDWPFACSGPKEFDAVAFAQTVEAEEGPTVKQVLDWYKEISPPDPVIVTAVAAAISGLFAYLAWQPSIPGLPRIRPWQRAQLKVTLKLASELLSLEPPTWVDEIA